MLHYNLYKHGKIAMTKFLLVFILSLLFTTSYANQEDQDLCIAQFANQCQAKCQETNDINCSQQCQDDAVNQCRQAGE